MVDPKVMCERIIEDYARTYGMNYMNLRLFNVAGSDGGKLGYQKDPIKHVLPNTCTERITWSSVYNKWCKLSYR